jgi:hypothetical protein
MSCFTIPLIRKKLIIQDLTPEGFLIWLPGNRDSHKAMGELKNYIVFMESKG